MDLFASCSTRQLPWFYSWRPDPEAEAADALMQHVRGLPPPHGI